MKNYIIPIIVIVLIGIIGYLALTQVPEKKYVINACHIDRLDINDLACTTGGPLTCLEYWTASDICLGFVSCTEDGELVKEANFDSCVSCTLDEFTDECAEQFPELVQWMAQ